VRTSPSFLSPHHGFTGSTPTVHYPSALLAHAHTDRHQTETPRRPRRARVSRRLSLSLPSDHLSLSSITLRHHRRQCPARVQALGARYVRDPTRLGGFALCLRRHAAPHAYVSRFPSSSDVLRIEAGSDWNSCWVSCGSCVVLTAERRDSPWRFCTSPVFSGHAWLGALQRLVLVQECTVTVFWEAFGRLACCRSTRRDEITTTPAMPCTSRGNMPRPPITIIRHPPVPVCNVNVCLHICFVYALHPVDMIDAVFAQSMRLYRGALGAVSYCRVASPPIH
jgi:hypothetical protein